MVDFNYEESKSDSKMSEERAMKELLVSKDKEIVLAGLNVTMMLMDCVDVLLTASKESVACEVGLQQLSKTYPLIGEYIRHIPKQNPENN